MVSVPVDTEQGYTVDPKDIDRSWISLYVDSHGVAERIVGKLLDMFGCGSDFPQKCNLHHYLTIIICINAPLRLAYGFGGAYVVGGQGKEGSTSASIEAAAPSF